MTDYQAPTPNNFGLTPEQVEGLDMTLPVTRSELLRALLAVHESIFAISHLASLSAGYNVDFPRGEITASLKESGKALDMAIQLMKNWGNVDDA